MDESMISIADTMASVTAQLTSVSGNLATILKKVSSTEENVGTLTNRMDRLEFEEEIQQETEKRIKKIANLRIHTLLPDAVDFELYRNFYYMRLWDDAKTYSGLGTTIGKTKKKDAERVIKYVSNWEPEDNEAFREYCNRQISAREHAKDREKEIIEEKKRRVEEIKSDAASRISRIKATVDPNLPADDGEYFEKL